VSPKLEQEKQQDMSSDTGLVFDPKMSDQIIRQDELSA